jgi:YegS/Rv2252/BmrU family lipid kinase
MMAAMIDPTRWFIVVNPASGSGRASRFRPRLIAALDRAGLPYRCVESAAPGDAMRLCASAVTDGYQRLLAVGGDGTFNELVNGLLASGIAPGQCLVAAAAGGTGNDWSRSMQIPDDPDRLATCMARAQQRFADIGIATGTDGSQTAFHNVAGAGIDAEVLGRTPKAGPRALAYLIGLARTLARYRAPEFEITVDGRITRGRFLLVLASIGPRCGGGMRLTPNAVVDDGWLDLLTIDPLTFAGALARLPKLFDGRLAGDPAFRVVRCRAATIRTESPCGVELDGQSYGATPVTVTVQPGVLRALDCR